MSSPQNAANTAAPQESEDEALAPPPSARNFVQVISSLRYGYTAEELDKAIQNLTKAVQDRGRNGKMTLTLHLKPGKGGQIEIFDEFKVTEPKQERSSTIMFATVEGHLSRSDPNQRSLGLRQVKDEERPAPRRAV